MSGRDLASAFDGAQVHVIAAHADDETLGCGGLLALLAGRAQTRVSVLADGETSRSPVSSEPEDLIGRREKAATAALASLGVVDVRFHRLADNRLDSYPLLEVARIVESDAAGFAADLVLLPWAGDLNIDHEIASRAGLTAYRPVPGASGRVILFYEVASSTGWRPGGGSTAFDPTVTVDISAVLGQKIHALEQYGEEIPESPHARSVAGVRALAAHRGHMVGVPAAEGFIPARWRL